MGVGKRLMCFIGKFFLFSRADAWILNCQNRRYYGDFPQAIQLLGFEQDARNTGIYWQLRHEFSLSCQRVLLCNCPQFCQQFVAIADCVFLWWVNKRKIFWMT